MTSRQAIVLYMRHHANATVREVAAGIGFTVSAVDNIMRNMHKCGELARIGQMRAPSGRLEYVYELRIPAEGRFIMPLRAPEPAPKPPAPKSRLNSQRPAPRTNTAALAGRSDMERAWSQPIKIQQPESP